MIIDLVKLPETTAGVYGPNRDALPERCLYLAPDAAKAFGRLERESGGLVYTEILMSADATLAAKEQGREPYDVSYSPHGYGLAFDLDVDRTLRKLGWRYERLVEFLESHGWAAFRRDGQRGPEDWHFTFIGRDASKILGMVDPVNQRTWTRAAEHVIQFRFGLQLQLTLTEQQEALARLGLYHGNVDGLAGPLMAQAKRLFERQWSINSISTYLRTLAFVTATRRVQEPAQAAA